MARAFSNIRRMSLRSKNVKHYFIYALGEVILVMIGIILALQVNNIKEERKNAHLEMRIYENFIAVLTQDSIHLAEISAVFNNSLKAHKYFIENNSDAVLEEMSFAELEQEVLKTLNVSHSFFPRFGIYQEVLNNGEFALLNSTEIKNQLTEIYERRYKLYEHVDMTVEKKIHFDLQPVIKGKFRLFTAEDDIKNPNYFNKTVFREEYEDFTTQLRNMNAILSSTKNIIAVMDENIRIALKMLRAEVNKKSDG